MSRDFIPHVRMIICVFLAFMGQIFSADTARAGRIEAGQFTAHDTFLNQSPVRVNFQENFDVAPIVVAISNERGGDSASIRISNITTTGFDELLLETDNFDGQHVDQQIYYIAVEPGRHVLPDGTVIEAGRTNTAATQFGSGVAGTASFTNVSFSRPLASAVSIISQLQTFNSETRNVANATSRPHITALAVNPSSIGFQLALERSQASRGPLPSVETIGWIAFPAGSNGTIPDVSGNNIVWSSVNTVANIRGTQDGCFVNGFGQTSATRISVAKKITRNNPDGGWLRFCGINDTTISVRVEEDRDQDSERNLSIAEAEAASIITFSRAFHSELTADIDITKSSENFADSITTPGFAVPNATFDYVINITNSGNSRPNFDTVIVMDTLPSGVAMVIDDIDGAGSGPIRATDGSVASELNYIFSGLSSLTDSVAFSTDGVNFNYIPVDSGDGTDPNITHIRVTFFGAMAPQSGGTNSSVELRFRTRIQ